MVVDICIYSYNNGRKAKATEEPFQKAMVVFLIVYKSIS